MTDYNWNEICKVRTKLEEYYELEGNSHGEAVQALCHLSQYPDYMTQELWNAVVDAMQYELNNYTTNAKIVTTPTTYTHDVTELEWNA